MSIRHPSRRPRRGAPPAPGSQLKLLASFGAVAAVFHVVAALGLHAMNAQYWPRFTQADVLGDLAWLLFASLSWVSVLAIALCGPSLLVALVLPGSVWRKEEAARARAQPLSFDQLSWLSLLWFACPIALAAARSEALTARQTENVLLAAALFVFVVVWSIYARPRDARGGAGPTVGALRGSMRLFAFLPAIAIPAFLVFYTTGQFTAWYVSVFSDVPPQARKGGLMVSFGGPLAVMAGAWFALLLFYGRARAWLLPAAGVASCVVVLMFISTRGVLELARIAHMRNATLVFDARLEPLASKLVSTNRVGDYAMANADVVFAFGSELVIAAPGTATSTSRCNFAWLTSNVAPGPRPSVNCLALPRDMVTSINP